MEIFPTMSKKKTLILQPSSVNWQGPENNFKCGNPARWSILGLVVIPILIKTLLQSNQFQISCFNDFYLVLQLKGFDTPSLMVGQSWAVIECLSAQFLWCVSHRQL